VENYSTFKINLLDLARRSPSVDTIHFLTICLYDIHFCQVRYITLGISLIVSQRYLQAIMNSIQFGISLYASTSLSIPIIMRDVPLKPFHYNIEVGNIGILQLLLPCR